MGSVTEPQILKLVTKVRSVPFPRDPKTAMNTPVLIYFTYSGATGTNYPLRALNLETETRHTAQLPLLFHLIFSLRCVCVLSVC